MADAAANHAYPKEIAAALVKVMSEIGTLAKGNENKFDKYNYASIDDFLAFVREPLHKHGLSVVTDEIAEPRLQDVTKKDGKPMAMWWARYSFAFIHESGAMSNPAARTVMVQANGAQSSGSAQSYALKQFLRSALLIPTGDGDDPDKEKTEISARTGEQETDLQKKANKIRKALVDADTKDALDKAWSDYAVDIDHIKRVSETAFEFLNKEYLRKSDEINIRATSFSVKGADNVLAG